MIATILRIEWLNLKRDAIALGLSFVLPIAFFTIFALIFGRGGADPAGSVQLEVLVVDLDSSALSRRFVRALSEEPGVKLVSLPAAAVPETLRDGRPRDGGALLAGSVPGSAEDAERARDLVEGGKSPAAIVIPAGFGESFGSPVAASRPVELCYEAANPIAREMLGGLLQSAAVTAAWDRLVLGRLDEIRPAGGMEEGEQRAWDALRGRVLQASETEDTPRSAARQLVPYRAESVGGSDPLSYSAAGIGVMFLLFSMAGAGGSILEEVESGTLERLLNSAVSIRQLLTAKWLFFAGMAVIQLSEMFAWGALFFGIDLGSPTRLLGFGSITCVTAGAAAALGILLASVCRTRAQLGGISTIAILIMSALGGSMIPRFLMPDFMETVSRFTFNGWALDGYLKVFGPGDPDAAPIRFLAALWPEVAVLAAVTAASLTLSYTLSRRWTTR